MKLDKHESDLYILPENEEEKKKIESFLINSNYSWHWVRSDVEGQSWYGKRFIEVPFGIDLREFIAKIN